MKYYSLLGGTTTDTEIQVAKENQIIIYIGPGATTYRYVIYKIEHDNRGYTYHMVNLDNKKFHTTDILTPLSLKYGIGLYYDDVNPEFMDAIEVAILVQEAQKQADAEAEEARKESIRIEACKKIGADKLNKIMPENVKGVIIAELNKTVYTDPSYECRDTKSVRTVILGFSNTSRNDFRELRKAAVNLPETAHLANSNKDFEYRYPYYILGKSPYYGWSVSKLTYFTRNGFIDHFAYTASDEDNIHITTPTRATTQPEAQSAPDGEYIIVDYSEKTIAVFGDTKPIKDELFALGGRYNGHLTFNGEKRQGWIFQKAKETRVRQFLGITE